MSFELDLLPKLDVEQVNSETGRYYKTPAGNFSSVTTILAQYYGTKGLDIWREAVGKDVADGIAYQASNQGTTVHDLLENYVLGRQTNQKIIPIYKILFFRYRDFLNKNLNKVYAAEHYLYSPTLKAAGTCDLLGRFHSHYDAVTDYKTVRSLPKLDSEKVEKYHIQMTAYALMVEEMYQRDFPYNMVLIGSQEESKILPHIVRNSKFRDKTRSIFNSVR